MTPLHPREVRPCSTRNCSTSWLVPRAAPTCGSRATASSALPAAGVIPWGTESRSCWSRRRSPLPGRRG